ncbi:protein-glutamine glutaminase family protein [Paraburkholderia strydomiana]|uniref:protein-glutamine glutaminase family protein n=1 Tax=Paraburkholderia strydomiana TaxID=1245417 RepID=UPI0038BADFE6
MHHIIDVGDWTGPPPITIARPFLGFKEEKPVLRSISALHANELFRVVGSLTCDPKSESPNCIPFLYPDDGCWGRASEICRLLAQNGVDSCKVWNYGKLKVATANNPACSVSWGWHVAPAVLIADEGSEELFILDPSLFSSVCLISQWTEVQGDSASVLAQTPAQIFYRSKSGETAVDPDYTETGRVLATYRLKLRLRAMSSVGPPPYEDCVSVKN